MVCRERIGWRDDARKIILLATGIDVINDFFRKCSAGVKKLERFDNENSFSIFQNASVFSLRWKISQEKNC